MQDVTHRTSAAAAIDPITLEVIRHALVSITNQIEKIRRPNSTRMRKR